MIYLIGGSPRAGKSLLAQRFISQKPINSFSCDFTYDMDQVVQLSGFAGAGIIEKGEAYFPILKQLVHNISYRTEDCIIEGEVILPQHILELAKGYDVRACFVGLSDTSMEKIIKHGGYFNWPRYKLENNLEHEVSELVERIITQSRVIENECIKYDQPYFDLSGNYTKRQTAALDFLLG